MFNIGTHHRSSYRLPLCTKQFEAEHYLFATAAAVRVQACGHLVQTVPAAAVNSTLKNVRSCHTVCTICMQARVLTVTMFTVRACSQCPCEIVRQPFCSVLVSEHLFHLLLPPLPKFPSPLCFHRMLSLSTSPLLKYSSDNHMTGCTSCSSLCCCHGITGVHESEVLRVFRMQGEVLRLPEGFPEVCHKLEVWITAWLELHPPPLLHFCHKPL